MSVALQEGPAAPWPPRGGEVFDLRSKRFSPGYWRQFLDDPYRFWIKVAARHGDIFRVGEGKFYILHPDHVGHVLVKAAKRYEKAGNVYFWMGLMVGEGVLTSKGATWKRQRKSLQPMFLLPKMEALVPGMMEVIEGTHDELLAAADADQPVDVCLLGTRMAVQVVNRCLVQIDLRGRGPQLYATLRWLNDWVNRHVGVPSALKFLFHPLPKLPSLDTYRFRKHLRWLEALVLETIEERRKDPSGPDVLSALLRSQRDSDGIPCDREIRDQLMTMLVAGAETTATTMGWMAMFLSQHPDCRRRLEDEVDRVLGDRAPAWEDLPNLSYARWVVDETLRLKAPAPLLRWKALEDDEIDGVHIPKGSVVALNSHGTHRHPDFWEAPEAFRPERFSPEESQGRHRYAYLPFSVGPRNCIGSHFALVELQLAVARLAQSVRLDLLPGHPTAPFYGFNVRPIEDIRCRVIRRR